MQTPPSFPELLETLQRDAPSARFRIPIGWWWEAGQPALTQVTLVGGVNHILLTGQTDSGKDSWARVACLSLIRLHGPDEIQCCFVDGKGLDWAPWEHKAHTWGLAIDPPEIDPLLRRLQAERWRRTKVLRAAGVTHWEATERPLFPLLVVAISELSLLQDAIGSAALEQWLNTELGTGRAVGMRYLIATQTASQFKTRWRSQISLWVAGYQPSKHQDAPNTGLTTAELRALGVTPPSQLPAPPTGAGVITAVDAGRRAATVRATVVDAAMRQQILAALPERSTTLEAPVVSSVSVATSGSAGAHPAPRRSVAHAHGWHRRRQEFPVALPQRGATVSAHERGRFGRGNHGIGE